MDEVHAMPNLPGYNTIEQIIIQMQAAIRYVRSRQYDQATPLMRNLRIWLAQVLRQMFDIYDIRCTDTVYDAWTRKFHTNVLPPTIYMYDHDILTHIIWLNAPATVHHPICGMYTYLVSQICTAYVLCRSFHRYAHLVRAHISIVELENTIISMRQGLDRRIEQHAIL